MKRQHVKAAIAVVCTVILILIEAYGLRSHLDIFTLCLLTSLTGVVGGLGVACILNGYS